MKNKFITKADIIAILIIIISFGFAVFFFQRFPERVATHFDLAGNVNGYSSKAVAAFMFPSLMLGIFILLKSIPYIDPNRERYQEFQKSYSLILIAILVFFFILYLLSGSFALGASINIGRDVLILVGILFIVMGNYFGKIKKNWFMGIRTPWTLSSEKVWNKTHRLGGKLFIGSGFLIALCSFLPGTIRIGVFICALILCVIVPIVYSYVIYKQN